VSGRLAEAAVKARAEGTEGEPATRELATVRDDISLDRSTFISNVLGFDAESEPCFNPTCKKRIRRVTKVSNSVNTRGGRGGGRDSGII
jgi:hypothetical protein